MKLTRFLRLRKAVEGLDPDIIRKKLRQVDQLLRGDGLPLDVRNTAITQEGIFYIEPESGVATKVIAYISDFAAELTPEQRSILSPEGYTDRESIERFHPYHLMRCNTLTLAERDGWAEPFRITKRTDGKLPYRITSVVDPKKKRKPEIYQVIRNQQLYVCNYCFWKTRSILDGPAEEKREDFQPKFYFDVNLLHSWNSHGLLSKDYGFTNNMYPGDWQEISRLRQEQVHHRCEACFEDLSERQLRDYLHVHPTDHVLETEGYFRLECLCIACIAELPAYSYVKERREFRDYQAKRAALAPAADPWQAFMGVDRSGGAS